MRGMLAGPTVGAYPRVRPPVGDVAGGQPFAPVGAGLKPALPRAAREARKTPPPVVLVEEPAPYSIRGMGLIPVVVPASVNQGQEGSSARYTHSCSCDIQ